MPRCDVKALLCLNLYSYIFARIDSSYVKRRYAMSRHYRARTYVRIFLPVLIAHAANAAILCQGTIVPELTFAYFARVDSSCSKRRSAMSRHYRARTYVRVYLPAWIAHTANAVPPCQGTIAFELTFAYFCPQPMRTHAKRRCRRPYPVSGSAAHNIVLPHQPTERMAS